MSLVMKSFFERTGRLGPKIDLFARSADAGGNFRYIGSTRWHKRCKDAVASIAAEAGRPASDYLARFDKRAR